MRKARTVNIPDDRILDEKTYQELSDHAYKSASWYISAYNKNSYEIKEKLLQKGFIDDEIIVNHSSSETSYHNIIEETFKKLTDNYMLDDMAYVKEFIQSGINSGKSLNALKTKLRNKKIPYQMIEEALNDTSLDTDEEDGLDRQASIIARSGSFQRLDEFKKKQTLVRRLVSKGFDMGDIYSWIDDNEESWK